MKSKSKPLLSICIPTYNRSIFLKEALDSIQTKYLDQIEIVISDDPCSSETQKIVQSFSSKFKHLIYHSSSDNLGFDRNLLKTIELSNGKYCHLFGDDDAFFPFSIDALIENLEKNCDLYLSNRISFDFGMRNQLESTPWIKDHADDQIFSFNSVEEWIHYLDRCNNLGALFAFMSSVTFKKEYWNRKKVDTQFIGSFYVFVPQLLSSICNNCTLCVIKQPLIKHRQENERILTSNLAKRYLLEAFEYRKFFDALFTNPKIKNAFEQVLLRHTQQVLFPSFKHVLIVKAYSNKEYFKQTVATYSLDKVRTLYFKLSYLFPKFFIRWAQTIYKKFFKSSLTRKTFE
jgi:abequosyltransferase